MFVVFFFRRELLVDKAKDFSRDVGFDYDVAAFDAEILFAISGNFCETQTYKQTYKHTNNRPILETQTYTFKSLFSNEIGRTKIVTTHRKTSSAHNQRNVSRRSETR